MSFGACVVWIVYQVFTFQPNKELFLFVFQYHYKNSKSMLSTINNKAVNLFKRVTVI